MKTLQIISFSIEINHQKVDIDWIKSNEFRVYISDIHLGFIFYEAGQKVKNWQTKNGIKLSLVKAFGRRIEAHLKNSAMLKPNSKTYVISHVD